MNKKKCFSCLLILSLSFCCIRYVQSDCYDAKRLIAAIKQNDIVLANEIVSENSECINCFPSVMPRWWRGVWDYSVVYPLQEACFQGNYQMVKLLIKYGADPNVVDDQEGYFPLYYTFYLYNPERFKIAWALIEAGADINAKQKYTEESVFIEAAYLSGEESDDILEEQKKVLLYFINNSKLEIEDYQRILFKNKTYNIWFAKKLIEKFPELLNKQQEDGTTFLMLAAYMDNEELVKYLLEAGVDAEIKDEDGKTAYDYALEGGNSEIAEQIKAYRSE